VGDKESPGQPKKCEHFELQPLFDENPTQTLLELSKALNVTQRPSQNAGRGKDS